MNEFIEQFLIECHELVEQATHDLLALEERPDDRERLDGAFRAFHTLKGAAGIVEFEAMETALHAAEEVLSSARSGKVAATPVLISDCLTCLDQVVQWLDAMEITGEPPADAGPVAEAIAKRFGQTDPTLRDQELPAEAEIGAHGDDLRPAAFQILREQIALLEGAEVDAPAGRTVSALRVAANVLRSIGRGDEAGQLDHLALREGVPDPGLAVAAIRPLLEGRLAIAGTEAAGGPREPTEPAGRGVRVDVERIDALVYLAGELGVAKNALAHAASQARDGADVAGLLKDQYAVLDRLVAELQLAVLQIRVLPLRQVFQRFPRLVREMVLSLGKPAHLVTEGEGTEADKAIVDNLFEPLLHVIRNAMDHGIERPEDRLAAGKPPSATIRLTAKRDGEHVSVAVSDDGGGIDIESVRRVALHRGLVDIESLAALSDAEVTELIFAPGFSTAGTVTNLSGRGVGMDAVRTAIERLGGRVALDSRAGQGTTVSFLLPFTLLISRVMTVEAGGQVFGIPLEAIVETVRVPRKAFSRIGAAQAFVLRDRTVPLVDLALALGEARGPRQGDANIVVASAGGHLAGLEVDRLGERLDVMLKPMEGLLSGTPGVAGTTLLGDGRVLIVLDLAELLQ
ncbi:chemotaxis protein CheA [Phenylobacterium hankyongense]|uniref:chemotaxis protein CheA n=1 Tax=Phenylobacterium hankyongense TaxID=1813876 RepID=UPI001A9D7C21|nr:chemotaxis protein CheA [Phenylobacterium hankyongense]